MSKGMKATISIRPGLRSTVSIGPRKSIIILKKSNSDLKKV